MTKPQDFRPFYSDAFHPPAVGELGFVGTTGGDPTFRSEPGYTNDSREPRLEGWLGSWNNVSSYARGVGRVTEVKNTDRGWRFRVKSVAKADLPAALEELGWSSLCP